MAPAPFYEHQLVQSKLATALYHYLLKHRLGDVVTAPVDIVFGMTDIVQPDIVFISNKRKHIISKRIIGAPDLLIEILSQSTSSIDRKTKKALYERYGVTEYWIVDIDQQSIDQFILKKKKYILKASLGIGATLHSTTVAGFSLDISKIF